MPNSNRNQTVGCFFWLVAIIGGVIYAGFSAYNRHQQVAPFKDYINSYSRVAIESPALSGVAPYVCGKVVAIDKGTGQMDPLYFQLPDELRATKPSDVGMVVWLVWGEETVGGYSDGASAILDTCQMRLIDMESAKVIADNSFRGPSPPSTKKGGGPRSGGRPIEDIIAFLKRLPKQRPAATSATDTVEHQASKAQHSDSRPPSREKTPRSAALSGQLIDLDLEPAVERGLVQVNALGSSLDSISVEFVSSSATDSVRLRIPAGTYFVAAKPSHQDMVVRVARTVELTSNGRVTVSLEAAGTNMRRSIPNSADRFTLGHLSSGDLKSLLGAPVFSRASLRVQQFSIWTLTDNPPSDGYVGIGKIGFGAGPVAEELQQIRQLFESAKINLVYYNVFRREDRSEPPIAANDNPQKAPSESSVPNVPEPRQQALPQPALEEQAAGALRMAKTLLSTNPSASKRRLEDILAKYPGTPTAAEAERILKTIP